MFLPWTWTTLPFAGQAIERRRICSSPLAGALDRHTRHDDYAGGQED
jgi:hypothetical protein